MKSLKKNSKGIAFIIAASFATSIGQMLWKLSYNGKFSYILIGFILYGLGAILMIIALKYGSLSVIHPLMSLGYIFALILGTVVLKEIVTLYHILAVGIIMAGVLLIGGNDV